MITLLHEILNYQIVQSAVVVVVCCADECSQLSASEWGGIQRLTMVDQQKVKLVGKIFHNG